MVHGRKRRRCGHCDYVEVYRLTREDEIRQLDTVEGQDSGAHPITFKEFLIGLAGKRVVAL